MGLCVCLALGWVFYRFIFIGHRQQPAPPSAELNALSDDANLSIQEIYHTATRDGIKEWSLKAQTARYVEEQHLVYLSDLIKGNVVVDNAKYRLRTDALQYKHQQRVLYSHVPVEIEGPSLHLLAQRMSFDLNANIAVLEGDVKGAFSETFTP